MDTFQTALLSAGGAIVVCLINNIWQNNATRKIIEYRISKLEEKVDKHNNLIERTYSLEKTVAVLEEKIGKEDDRK